jgi:hypothetical protein
MILLRPTPGFMLNGFIHLRSDYFLKSDKKMKRHDSEFVLTAYYII